MSIYLWSRWRRPAASWASRGPGLLGKFRILTFEPSSLGTASTIEDVRYQKMQGDLHSSYIVYQ
jgi:hypothetical protein